MNNLIFIEFPTLWRTDEYSEELVRDMIEHGHDEHDFLVEGIILINPYQICAINPGSDGTTVLRTAAGDFTVNMDAEGVRKRISNTFFTINEKMKQNDGEGILEINQPISQRNNG